MGIHFQQLGFKYDQLASKETLSNINIDIDAKDEFIFILGHTGSGKSTLVQHMNALLLPTSGNLTVFNKQVVTKYANKIKFNTKKNHIKYNIKGHHILGKGVYPVYSTHLKEIRSNIGLVFQFPEYQLFEQTVLKDVMFGPLNYGQNQAQAERSSREACKLVGLTDDLLDRSPFSLSGGQMRRVAIAGTLAINPNILILDEPTVGLDPVGKEDLLNLLTKINTEMHKSIIVISHDMNIVARFAKRVIVMDEGKVVYDGKKRPLFENIDNLLKFNLDLPTCAKLAIDLKKKGLINFSHLPLTKEELMKVIQGGDIYE